MRSNYAYYLGVLTSESFSERMISVENLLVDAHQIRLDNDNIDKMVVLRMNKRLRGFQTHCMS